MASRIDLSFKTMFSPVCWSRHDVSFCYFITAEKKIRTKWKVRNGVMLKFNFLKCVISSRVRDRKLIHLVVAEGWSKLELQIITDGFCICRLKLSIPNFCEWKLRFRRDVSANFEYAGWGLKEGTEKQQLKNAPCIPETVSERLWYE